MKQVFPLFILLTIFFSACTKPQTETNFNSPTTATLPSVSTQTTTRDRLAIQATERIETVIALQTAITTPLAVTPISTPTLLGNYKNEITWHPQEVLIDISESANDGNPWIAKWPLLRLYWDGTIIQGVGNEVKVAQMSRPQMCKLFNSIAKTGWFNVDYLAYNPIFAGTWGESIGVYTWQERVGGGYLFTSALEGAGASEILFCGDCIKTNHGNFIPTAESNTYYLIFNNLPTDFQLKTDFREPGVVPADYQITCQISDGTYPLVPVDQEAKYVIFSGSGRRAVGILNQNSTDVQSAIYKIDGGKQYINYDHKSFGANALIVIPRLWAKDNQFVYVSLYPNDAELQPFHEAIALQQIDTNTGYVRYIFQGQADDFYSYKLSNTGSRLAYIRQDQNPLQLVIVDLATGNEVKISIESSDIPSDNFIMAGSLQFNFELDKLFFSAISGEDSSQTTFFMVDLLNPTKLYSVDQRPGAYKLRRVNYSSEHPKWLEICPIHEGLTADDYCSGLYIDLP